MNSPTRRSFLKSTAAVAAAPFILPSRVWSADTPPSGRFTMGFIGMGKQNGGLLGNFLSQDDIAVVAVCDVDTTRRENAHQQVTQRYSEKKPEGWKGCEAYNDFRKIIERDDIDAVCIATPDHWHALITLAALRAGKDVYCEKPLTHNIAEAKAVIAAVPANKRVLQTGSMQRSMKEFRVAAELVRNGHIGKVEKVIVSFGDPGRPCDLPTEDMEPGLDWDFWQGPAEKRGYSSVLSPRGVHNHFPDWRNYMEYGGGMVTDWGAHHIDIAQWGLGMDDSGPVESRPPEGWSKDSKRGATLVYADGTPVTHGDSIGVHFFGSEGEVQVTRGRFAISQGGESKARFLDPQVDKTSLEAQLIKAEKEILGESPKVALYQSRDHIRDFIDAMKSRKQPITHEGVGGRSAICCHLMNQAYYHGQPLKWDPAKMEFAGGTGNPEWLTRDYKNGWKLEA